MVTAFRGLRCFLPDFWCVFVVLCASCQAQAVFPNWGSMPSVVVLSYYPVYVPDITHYLTFHIEHNTTLEGLALNVCMNYCRLYKHWTRIGTKSLR